jgi:hypothetical protein
VVELPHVSPVVLVITGQTATRYACQKFLNVGLSVDRKRNMVVTQTLACPKFSSHLGGLASAEGVREHDFKENIWGLEDRS